MKINPKEALLTLGFVNQISAYLYEVLIDNPGMFFDVGNMANILSNTKVTEFLFSNPSFNDFLFNNPEFSKMLLAEDWLIQIPEMKDF